MELLSELIETVAAHKTVCDRFSDSEGTKMLSAMYRTQKDKGERHAIIEKGVGEKDLKVGLIFSSMPASTPEAVGMFHTHTVNAGGKPLDNEIWAMLVGKHEVMCISQAKTVCYEPATSTAAEFYDILVMRARGIQGGYNKFKSALEQKYGKFTIQTQEEKSVAQELKNRMGDVMTQAKRNSDWLFKTCTLGEQ